MAEALLSVDPLHTALLVMDIEPAALGSLEGAEDLLSRLAGAIAIVRRKGGKIVYVRMALEDADYDALPARNKLARSVARLGSALHSNSSTTAIHERVAPEPGDIVVRKTRVGAFTTTDLHEQLRERAITTLVLAGVATSGVVLSTVRDAADRDYQIIVLADGIADRDPEVHKVLTEKIFPRQADVITIAQLSDLLSTTLSEAG